MLEQAHQIHPFLVIQVLIPLSKHGKHMHAPCTGRSSLFPNLCRRLCSEVTSWSCLLQSLLIKDAYIAKEQEYPTKDSLLFRTLLYHKYALGILAGKRILTPLRQETFNLPHQKTKIWYLLPSPLLIPTPVGHSHSQGQLSTPVKISQWSQRNQLTLAAGILC